MGKEGTETITEVKISMNAKFVLKRVILMYSLD